mmetsp:Transcript_45012/g.121244  ORF Transcript_45012/g.121244 Transcript_45012/m.121244 type:complete len:236 (-) Transcript_45012:90-797(-)
MLHPARGCSDALGPTSVNLLLGDEPLQGLCRRGRVPAPALLEGVDEVLWHRDPGPPHHLGDVDHSTAVRPFPQQSDRGALPACTASPADAMDVVLAVLGRGEVHDEGDVLHVQPPPGHVRGDEHGSLAAAEGRHGFLPLALLAVGVKHLDVGSVQRRPHLLPQHVALLRVVGKDQNFTWRLRIRGILRAQDGLQCSCLVHVVLDDDDLLVNVAVRSQGVPHPDPDLDRCPEDPRS